MDLNMDVLVPKITIFYYTRFVKSVGFLPVCWDFYFELV